MKLSFSTTCVITLAVAQAREEVNQRRKLEVVDFSGDGCINYSSYDDADWTTLPLTRHYISPSIPLGFDFTFGETRTTLHISAHGHIHFQDGICVAEPSFVDSYHYNIAPYWAPDALFYNPDYFVSGEFRYKQVENKFVVLWEEVNPASETNRYQVVLSSDDSPDPKICFCYEKMEWASEWFNKVGMSMGNGSGFHLAGFNQNNAIWNGIGTDGNGVQHLDGKSYCFNPDIVDSTTTPTEDDLTFVRPSPPGGSGDPHFKTWKNEHYQYHGQCDLVLAKDANFANDLGLDIHIRTKLVRNWSYIKTAAIRIGDDTLEIEGSGKELDKEVHYWINYEYQGALTEFAGFPVTIKADGTKLHKNRFEIDLSSKYPGQKIAISTFKEFVKVDFVNPTAKAFGNTAGMLGEFQTGKTLARDGATVLDDFTDLGREWQVLPADKKLFREASAPQFPELCMEPEDPRGDRARRLDESAVSARNKPKLPVPDSRMNWIVRTVFTISWPLKTWTWLVLIKL